MNKVISFFMRREQDSNLRTSFAGYTLSRRASSTTRAPLQKMCCTYNDAAWRVEIGCKIISFLPNIRKKGWIL